MIFNFNDYVLDVDVEKTREFYNSDDCPVTSLGCVCDGCRNYDKAIMTASASVLDFLREFGIDPKKPGEVFILG